MIFLSDEKISENLTPSNVSEIRIFCNKIFEKYNDAKLSSPMTLVVFCLALKPYFKNLPLRYFA